MKYTKIKFCLKSGICAHLRIEQAVWFEKGKRLIFLFLNKFCKTFRNFFLRSAVLYIRHSGKNITFGKRRKIHSLAIKDDEPDTFSHLFLSYSPQSIIIGKEEKNALGHKMVISHFVSFFLLLYCISLVLCTRGQECKGPNLCSLLCNGLS